MTTNVEIVSSIYDNFNRGDLDAAVSVVAEDFQLVDIAAGMTFQGPEGFRMWLGTWAMAIPDAQVRLVSVVADGDRVATEHIGGGLHTGPLMTPNGSIPPTGRRIELQMAEVFELEAGKIKTMRAYFDSATLMRQLGLLPAMAGA